MTKIDDFKRYEMLALEPARKSLAEASTAAVTQRGEPAVSLATDAAKLLFEPPTAAGFEGLTHGLKTLATLAPPVLQGTDQLDPLRMQEHEQDFELPLFRDPSGDGRDVYLPLVLHLHLAAFGKHYEAMPQGLWSACEDAMPAAVNLVRGIEQFADGAPPPPRMALTAWQALCILQFGKLSQRDVDIELADSVIHQLVNSPGPNGAFHPKSPYDATGPGSTEASFDVWTYRELSGFQALANVALLRRNPAWAERVQEIAMFHVEHTQPDYTTSQPWGLFGFAWSPKTRHFADQQLHDAVSYGSSYAELPAGQVGLVPAMLLADAGRALATFS